MRLSLTWKIIIVIAVIAAAIAIYFAVKDNGPAYELAAVKRGDIIQEVSVTGNVKPAKEVELAFEISGRVAGVYADIGKNVYSGGLLVSLENSEISTELSKAESDLATQQSKLDEAGTTLSNLYTSALNVLNEAQLKADDAVRPKTSPLFSGSRTSAYNLTFLTCNDQARIESVAGRLASEDEVDKWKTEINSVSKDSSVENREAALKNGRSHLGIVISFLENLNKAINADCVLTQTSLDTSRANLNIARTNLNTAFTAISDKEQAIASQKATTKSTENLLKSYEATVSNINAQLAKTRLYSPINGVVTVQNAKVGEIVEANGKIISVISASNFEIEANITEADIAKVKVGDEARVTLDAYGDDAIFWAMVSKINPAETVIEGVPTYKTTFQFKEKDERIKSGMTANIDISTDKKSGVLYVPQRTVIREKDRIFVRVFKDNVVQEVDVVLGIKSFDANIEIVSGLNEGDQIVVSKK